MQSFLCVFRKLFILTDFSTTISELLLFFLRTENSFRSVSDMHHSVRGLSHCLDVPRVRVKKGTRKNKFLMRFQADDGRC